MSETKVKRKRTKQENIRLAISATVLLLFVGLVIGLVIYFWPYIYGLLKNDQAVKDKIIAAFEAHGSYAWLLLLICSMLQVILAVLPNGIFELVSGLMYGPAIGVVISLAGVTLGSLLVLLLVKAFGKGFASLFVNLEESDRFKFLKEEKRCLIMIFGLLFIPGLPKDFIVFLVPFMNVKIRNFLLVNLIARAPSTILSVYLGDSLMTGNIGLAIVLGICAGIIGALCLIFNKQIEAFINKITTKKNKELDSE